MKKLWIMMGISAALCGCVGRNHTQQDTTRTLVVYYSQTGATKTVAETLQAQLSADIAAIEAVHPYDGDYDATIARWLGERDSNKVVEIKPLTVELSHYDTIFLGFPVWGGTYALPVKTFLSENAAALKGKTVVTFATFGSGGINTSTADVVAALPETKVLQGYGVRNARLSYAPDEINRFLIENGYKAGQIDPLPDYSAMRELTAEDIKIFKAATEGYKYPLGEAQRVATRTTATSTDYQYEVRSQTPDGKPVQGLIYITLPNTPNATPEFTQVVR